MSWEWLLLISLVVMFAALSLKIPVAIALPISGFVGLTLAADIDLAESGLRQVVYSANQNFLLVSIPLFILMAEILTATGISERSFRAVTVMFSGRRSPVPLATIVLGALLAAVSGSSAANVASLGRVAMGEMVAQGYRKSMAAGVVAVSGGLGIIIPPSIPAILYGYVNEVSVIKIFTAGIVPGLVIAASSLLITVLWVSRQEAQRTKEREPQLAQADTAPAPPTRAFHNDAPGATEPQSTLLARIKATLGLLPLVLLVSLVLGTIYKGVATPTEAAAIGVVGAFFVALITGVLTIYGLRTALDSALRGSGFILLILFGAVYYVFFLNYTQIPNEVIALVTHLNLGSTAVLLASCFIVLVLGTLMDTISLVLVTTPILAPVLTDAGYEPLAVAMILLILIEMGLNTPPFGLNIFILLGVGEPQGFSYRDVLYGCLVYLIPGAIAIGAIVAFPGITTLGSSG